MHLRRAAATSLVLLLAACVHAAPRDAALNDELSAAAAEAGDGGSITLADHAAVEADEVVVVAAGTEARDTAEALGLRPPRQAVAPVAEGVAALIAFRAADGGLVWSTIDTDDLDLDLDGTYPADLAVTVTEDGDRLVLSQD